MNTETIAPGDLLSRLRRDVERNLLRTRNGLKHLSGVGRPAVGLSERDVVWSRDKAQLLRYRSERRSLGPPVLLVMSLVSRSYVLDLRPGSSFVEFLLGEGFDVFLADWGEPDELEAANVLETYCDDMLPAMIEATRSTAGAPTVTVYGYCLGGLLALLYGAGHPGPQMQNLVVMATPVDFTHMGPMTTLMQEGRLDPKDLIDETGNVPADVIYDSFRILKPTSDLASYANLWQHLWQDEFLESYQAINQWSTDHVPFPGACFVQLVELFTRANQLAEGRVPLGGRIVDLADITCPFLNIIAEKDHIVPPEASTGLTALIGSDDKSDLFLPAGHAGLVIGRSAQKRTMPAIAAWLRAHEVTP